MEEQLKIIQEMIEKTRIRMADSGIFFILWGWFIMAACIGNYLFVLLLLEEWIGLNWFVFMGGGLTLSIIIGRRQAETMQVKTYSYVAISSLWQACVWSIFVVAFIAFPLGVISIRALVPIIALVSGIGTFVTGKIIEWKPLQWAGILWWAATIVCMGLDWTYHTLVMALVIIPAYLIPGYLLKNKYLHC